MSKKIKNSNLFVRIFTITILVSLFSYLSLSLPNYIYGDSKEGKAITDIEEDLSEADDEIDVKDDIADINDDIDIENDADEINEDIDIENDINEVDDEIDVKDDLNDIENKVNGDDADVDVNNTENNTEKTKNTNSNLGTANHDLEIKNIKETKYLDNSLEINSTVPDSTSEIDVNKQLKAKEIIELFFKNISLFFINLWDQVM